MQKANVNFQLSALDSRIVVWQAVSFSSRQDFRFGLGSERNADGCDEFDGGIPFAGWDV